MRSSNKSKITKRDLLTLTGLAAGIPFVRLFEKYVPTLPLGFKDVDTYLNKGLTTDQQESVLLNNQEPGTFAPIEETILDEFNPQDFAYRAGSRIPQEGWPGVIRLDFELTGGEGFASSYAFTEYSSKLEGDQFWHDERQILAMLGAAHTVTQFASLIEGMFISGQKFEYELFGYVASDGSISEFSYMVAYPEDPDIRIAVDYPLSWRPYAVLEEGKEVDLHGYPLKYNSAFGPATLAQYTGQHIQQLNPWPQLGVPRAQIIYANVDSYYNTSLAEMVGISGGPMVHGSTASAIAFSAISTDPQFTKGFEYMRPHPVYSDSLYPILNSLNYKRPEKIESFISPIARTINLPFIKG